MSLHKLTVSAIMCNAVYFSLLAKLKHVKGSVSVHTRLHDLTPDVVVYIAIDREERRPNRRQRAHKVARLDDGRRWSTLS